MIIRVHDELVFDVIKSEREELEENVKSIMRM